MLSILIPTYNYSALPLVEELYRQCRECKINFEIIVLDDGSESELNVENEKINRIPNCKFEKNEINQGRARNRNLLAEKSSYIWLLFMDCDTFPKNTNFIFKYIETIKSDQYKVVFGGIAYKNIVPEKNQILRWKYGKKREEIDFNKRKMNPYLTTLTSNLLVKSEIFNSVKFDERIAEYGYEDFVFIQNLKSKKIEINHIDNPTYHLNYETSKAFLDKTNKALETLKFIEENNILLSKVTKIQKTHHLIKFLGIHFLLSYTFIKLKSILEKQLMSNNPSLFIFDIYKLCYYSNIKK